ncbi:hypothetical protein DFJ74DRAFT_689400 [Hyaloraphidium curvatum]|nr:hypothetical protein DFJ74DRAFT_689400 [Hyaloraphidium curvatum]
MAASTSPSPAPVASPEDVLSFWYPTSPPTFRAEWYRVNPAMDEEITRRFLPTYEAAARGDLSSWESSPRSALALVITMDQFPRNMFRSTARAFATDKDALRVAKDAIRKGFDGEMGVYERWFLYLPLGHSEVLEDQNEVVGLFEAMAKVHPECRMAIGPSKEHRDIVARFGRFPHRNEVLGRESTEEEVEFLENGGPNFGQGPPKKGGR